MANWDFCDDCNSGKHCCTHNSCDHAAPGISLAYATNDDIKKELKKRKLMNEKEKQSANKERLKQIQKLEKQLKLLKSKLK